MFFFRGGREGPVALKRVSSFTPVHACLLQTVAIILRALECVHERAPPSPLPPTPTLPPGVLLATPPRGVCRYKALFLLVWITIVIIQLSIADHILSQKESAHLHKEEKCLLYSRLLLGKTCVSRDEKPPGLRIAGNFVG